MSSKIYTKRTSIAGKVPTTSNIDTGELALNLRDGRLYSSNGTNVFEVGANVHSLSVGAGGFSIANGAITFPTSDGTANQILATNGSGTLSFTSSLTMDSTTINGDLTVDTNTLYVDATNNRVGVGTTSPAYQFEIENTGSNALLVLDRTDGAACFIEGQATRSAFGSVGATPLALAYNSAAVVTIGASGAITVNPDGANPYTFPTSDGSSGQVLVTNGSGTLTFQNQSGGGATANSFSVIEVGGTLVKANASTQRLSLVAGSNISLTPTDANNTIVISSTGGGEVSNAYLTSTFTTNADFQSALANTNLAISDRLQVANAITTLAGLTDVAQVTPSDGQVLKYSTSNTTYYFADATVTSSSFQATTANGTQTTFTSPISTSDPKDVLVTIDGVLQIPTTDYSISGTTVTISPAPLNDSVVVVRTGGIPVATQLQDLSDIAQVTPTDGHVLKYSSANSTYYFAAESGAAGGVSNAYLTSTFTTNTDFQSYVSNTNPRITSLEARPYITTANDETIATASQTVVDSFSATAFRSAKYIVQVTHDDDNNRFQTSEVLLVHNGSAAFLTEYGSVATAGPIASIDADVSGGNVRLLVTPSYNNSTIETVRITVSA